MYIFRKFTYYRKLKEEIKEYEKKRANELGFNIDFDSIDDFTEDEEKFFSLIDKEDYLNEKYKEIEKLEIKLHEEHEKSFDKKHEQAERIKEFYNELPDKILTIVENELSDIIDEYTIIIVEEKLDADLDYADECGFDIYRVKKYKTNKHLFLRLKGSAD